MGKLYEQLKGYRQSDYYGFHMPGHKRNESLMVAELPYGIDITEIEEFDDLHHDESILLQARERAALLFGAEETRFLINGSTAGILSAILGCTSKRGSILVARNCHKSVYHAIFLGELQATYLYPEFDERLQLNMVVSVAEIDNCLEQDPDIQAVVVVSPTYDGVVSDIQAIAEVVHKRNIPLIVDEAHGAHFGFHAYFPVSAINCGADIVIQSLHKTLPSLTQTAVIHMKGQIVKRDLVRDYLKIFQSTSPSYVLIASIDECVNFLKDQGDVAFGQYVKLLSKLRRSLSGLEKLSLVETDNYDKSKLVISTKNTNISGRELYWILKKRYHLQMEMAAGSYIIGMTSVADQEHGFNRLKQALYEIDLELEFRKDQSLYEIDSELEHQLEQTEQEEGVQPLSARLPRLEQVYKSSDDSAMKEMVKWQDSIGRVSMEYAYIYPPGIPLIVPGERISFEVWAYLTDHRKLGFSIEGVKSKNGIEVRVDG